MCVVIVCLADCKRTFKGLSLRQIKQLLLESEGPILILKLDISMLGNILDPVNIPSLLSLCLIWFGW